MSTLETQPGLTKKHCVPCEGGIPPLEPEAVARLLGEIPGWSEAEGGRSIRRDWTAKSFMAAIRFFDEVAGLAEAEGHHPDLHLAGYRNVRVELTTHAVGGLTENDFILAAKIDALPFEVKKPKAPDA